MGMAALKIDTRAPPPKRPKDRLNLLVKQGHIAAEHIALGERILKLHEAKLREPSPRMAFGHGSGAGDGMAALARVSARQKWERLFSVVGDAGESLVNCVIVDGMSLADAGKALNINPKAVLPLLQFVLNVLARF